MNNKKSLKFIHISKTAGTSIENIAIKHGIRWGRFDKEYGINHNNRFHAPFIEIPDSVKEKYEWFTVVRNPYNRIISEYYCKWMPPPLDQKNKYNIKEFNNLIANNIINRETNRINLDFHYYEQNKYIDDRFPIHIIKYENIQKEFNALMRNYDIDLKLNQYNNAAMVHKKFGLKDLSSENIELINTAYSKDFQLFGYNFIIL